MKNIFKLDKRSWLLLLGIYLFSGGMSFAAFSFWSGKGEDLTSPIIDQEAAPDGNAVFGGPKNQECPLNGAMYTVGEKELWEGRRPMAVMIENHEESRPHSGLSRADVIYEAVAEGGITRFMGVFYCAAAGAIEEKYDIGPVRSARTYFLDWASEYGENPLYVHVGGANCGRDEGTKQCTSDPRAQAIEQIGQYGWKDTNSWNDLDQFALSYKACRREPERTGETKATEHTMFCNSQYLWDYADENRGLSKWPDADDFRPWEFKDDETVGEEDRVGIISFDFWEGYKAYSVSWEYNSEDNTYLRSNGGEQQIEFLTGNPLESKVVVVQFAKETGPVDDHKHLLYTTIGQGKALVFQDGGIIEGKWAKKSRQARTVFTDNKGKEIEFNRGQIWIEVLPLGNTVDYGD
ncbi:DUF3048 domain-containing protein [Candidatus Shapirobacteria bacterium]|nr:DUF3048 domain-containing protein [Candidatus Shapirobacteria bacterium]